MAEVGWDDIFGAVAPDLHAVAQATRALVHQVQPGVLELAQPGYRSVSFALGEARMSEARLYLMPHRAWVNLGFYQGASLPDPMGLLEGTGKALRHVKLRGEIPEGVTGLIRAAFLQGADRMGVE